MKTTIYKVLGFTAFIISISSSAALAQITSTTSSSQTRTPEVARTQEAVGGVLDSSGRLFKEGLLAFKDNRRSDAGDKFNRSVEVFLYSALNIQRDQKLQGCYNQLIETIYRIEFPSEVQIPQVRSLAATCGWSIDNVLADDIAKLSRPAVKSPGDKATVAAVVGGGNMPADEPSMGFNTQGFEPSPLDDLARLELNSDEQQVDTNPVAQQQFQYLQVAVNNKSLGFSFEVNPLIQQYINHYRGRGRTTMEIGLYRSGMFMRMARRIFREEGIPENVAWLGQVESAWKPTAMSWASASGLWQFIPGTGARYGLRRTAHLDERNSFEGATRASARYLKMLAARYQGNWELALAAYNSGEGNVDRAIRRAGVSNYWKAYPYLPQETRNYVPAILATILVANNPHQYGFGHVRPAPPLMYDQVRVPASTNLSIIAQASDTSVQYLRYLNPELRTNMSPPEPYIVRVPAKKGNDVLAVFKRIPASKINDSNLANSNSGETWQNLSLRTGVSVADLMAANPGMAIPKGKVFVPVAAKGNNVTATTYSRPTTPNTPGAAAAAAKPKPMQVVKAKSGDTVTTLAARYGASATEVAKFNGLLVNSKLGAGREIKIPGKTATPGK